MKKWKKGMALALAAMLIGTTVDISAFAAEETGTVICDHHTEHTSECGYTEATAGADCTHEHSDDCYSEVTVCVHSHDESCGYSEGEEGSPCSHECSEETGCVKVEENCQHTEHDANCGYKETVEGTPCNYTCTECVQTDDDKKQNEEQQEEEPAECTCTEKCTEEVVNTDCAVCSAVDADITCCVGEETLECTCGTDDDAVHATDCPAYVAPENPECYCVEKCTEDNINVWCDVCGVQGAEACQSQGEESAVTYEYETASATYLSCDENGQNWETKTCGAATVLTSEMTTLESGWYVLNSDVTFSDRITISGTVNLILADGYTLTASQGVNVGKGNTLSIYGQSADTGAIRATGNENRSGIGGGACQSSGTIIIYGGSVTANGGTNAAGIGGGCEGSGGTTTIYGGVIEATGSNRYSWNGAAGIGGGTSNNTNGSGSSSGDIDVYGGIIFATGKNGADDIGGGYGAKGKGASDVTIECGLIFDRNGDGTVYGDFVLTSDFTLESDKSITIPGDATLTIAEDVTLTNNGTITYEAPTEGKGYTIDYVNEKITIDDKCETNTAENFTGTTITEKDLTENDFDKTVGYIRARVLSGITGTGTINQNTGTISIPSRPTLADLSIDNSAEGVVLSDAYYYSFESSTYDAGNWIKGNGNLVTVAPEQSIYIYKVATEESFRSEVQTLTAPARRTETPTGLGIAKEYPNEEDASDGRINGVTTDMEYRKQGADTWTACTGTEITGLTAGTYEVRYKATDTNYCGESSVTVVIEEAAVKGTQDTADMSYGDTVTLSVTDKEGNPFSNVTYKWYEQTGENWNEIAGQTASSYSTDTLNAGTYNIKCEITGTSFVYTWQFTEFTIGKATPNVSAVPTVAERTYHPLTALADNDLTGGVVTGVEGNTLAGTWSWQSTGVIPVVNNSGYVAVFTPTDTTNYETVTRTITVMVTKATPAVVTLPTATTITYGDALSASSLSGTAQYSVDNNTTVDGSFAWKDGSAKPTVADSDTTAYAVIFTPVDGANYNTVETTATLTVNKAQNAPNMPGSTMNVSNKYTKVGDVPLPDGWEWQDTDKETALEVDTPVTATAVYTGADKGNYENETVSISVTRNACDHVAGNILYTGEGEKAPTCTESGLGHKECTKCNTVMESGIVVNALGHTGGTATCKDKAVCTRCNQPYGSTNGSKHGNTEVRGYRAATCTSGGYTGDTYCKDCGTKLSSGTSTGATEHDYAGVVTKEATCTQSGIRTYTCSCGDSYTETISESNHNYSSKVTTQPTADQEGVMTYTCSICGHTYTDSIAKTGNGGTDAEDGNSTETEAPFIKDDAGKEGWDVIRAEVEDAVEGDTITVDMNGSTVVPGDVFNDIKGKDITMVFDMGNGITWSVNGKDITSDSVGDINFDVKVGADANNTIPVDIINKVIGERYSMNISLAYDGGFGFKAVMTLNVDAKNAGLIANLFYFNEQIGELEFICADEIAEDGTAELTFTHASEYTIVIDKEPMESATSPDTSDVSVNPLEFESDDKGSAWWILVLCIALATAGIVIIILKKKKQDEDAE